jgi:hypothetical protein
VVVLNTVLSTAALARSGAGTVGHGRARAPSLSEVAGLRTGIVPHPHF